MASQTDKKEEFRRYLEKSNVLATLTNILTDLFEMEMRPDDPGQYMYQKFGESLRTAPASPSQVKKDDKERRKGDLSTNHATPTATTEMVGSSSQDLHQLVSAPNKVDTVMSQASNDGDETAARNTQAQSSGTDQMDGQEGPAAFPTAPASTSSPKENAESLIAQDSLGSREQSNGNPMTSNTAGISPSPTPAQ